MVDYQYLPDMNDPVAKLRIAMDEMDGTIPPSLLCDIVPLPSFPVDAIRAYSIPAEKEDYVLPLNPLPMELDPQLAEDQPSDQVIKTRSNLRLFPPPVFTRQGIPQNYK